MSGPRALLAAILVACAAAAVGGAFARRALRAERRLREELLRRYGAEFTLLEELATKMGRGALALSRDDYSTGCRVLAKPGILVARMREGRSSCTFYRDGRLSLSLPGKLAEPARERISVKRRALKLKDGGSLTAVVAVWRVRAGPSRGEMVCEFAVEAGALPKR